MSHEREFDRTHSNVIASQHDDDLAPNHATNSSQLDAPAYPIASGLLQRKARDGNGVADGAEQAVANASSSSSSALPDSIMRKFESSLGTDLSSVRVHTGAESASAASAVGARAYTTGQDIHFAEGHYDPTSAGGQHLLAHEVAHTVQQRGGSPTRQNKLEVSSPFDAAEHEADRAAEAMVAGDAAMIASAPPSAARLVQRDPHNTGKGAPQINEKNSFDVEIKLPEKNFRYVTLSQSLKAKGSLELTEPDGTRGGASAPVTAGPSFSGTGGVGGKGEISLAEQHFSKALLGMQFDGSAKEKIAFQLTSEQLKASAGVEVRVNWAEIPWLKGAVDVNFIFAGVKWKDIQNDPEMKKVKVLAVEGAIGASGEGSGTIRGIDRPAKSSLAVQYVATAAPNWANIGAEVAKEVAKEGATTAGTSAATTTVAGSATAGGAATTGTAATGAVATEAAATTGGVAATGAAAGEVALVVDAAAVAAGAAAIILPLGVGALMVAGGMQTEKNVVASRAAIDMGLKMRTEAKAYVRAYASTITGGNATGQGALDANVKVLEYMGASGKNRADACAALAAKNNYAKLAADILAKFRDDVFEKGVAEYEKKFAPQFGVVEKLGTTWGMRGVFRKEFRAMLYADD